MVFTVGYVSATVSGAATYRSRSRLEKKRKKSRAHPCRTSGVWSLPSNTVPSHPGTESFTAVHCIKMLPLLLLLPLCGHSLD